MNEWNRIKLLLSRFALALQLACGSMNVPAWGVAPLCDAPADPTPPDRPSEENTELRMM